MSYSSRRASQRENASVVAARPPKRREHAWADEADARWGERTLRNTPGTDLQNVAEKVTLAAAEAHAAQHVAIGTSDPKMLLNRALETVRDDTPAMIQRYFRGPGEQLLREEFDALLRPLAEGGHEALLRERLADPNTRLSMESFEYASTREGGAFDALFQLGAGSRFADREQALALVLADLTGRRPGEDADMLRLDAEELASRFWARAQGAESARAAASKK